MFDAGRGTYTTGHTKVRQIRSLPAIHTSAAVTVSEVPEEALRAAKHAAGKERRMMRDFRRAEEVEKQARDSLQKHGVEPGKKAQPKAHAQGRGPH